MDASKYNQFKDNQQKLITDLNKGSIHAFHYIFDEFYRSLLLFAQSLMPNDHLAEDTVQESFIKLWERNEQFTSLQTIKAFLFLTVKHGCIDVHRHDTIVEHHLLQQSGLKETDDKEDGLEQKIIVADTVRLINKALKELPQQSYTICRMSLSGFKNQEIADHLAISINTVKTHKKRAFSTLRQSLGNDFFILLLIFTQEILK